MGTGERLSGDQPTAVEGDCAYCGEVGPPRPDPFGHEPACRSCWSMLAASDA